jgi:hypothetical protein
MAFFVDGDSEIIFKKIKINSAYFSNHSKPRFLLAILKIENLSGMKHPSGPIDSSIRKNGFDLFNYYLRDFSLT